MIKNQFIEKLITKIESYEKICIFCHQRPDFDAYGSAYALYHWINDNYYNLNKKIYLMVHEKDLNDQEKILFNTSHYFPTPEEMVGSLGIVVDTANESRILTQMHKNCKELISIDHHPKIETFSQLEYIDPLYPATAQILAEIFESLEERDYIFTAKVAQFLYAGIITDTNNLLSTSVLPSTYEVVSQLVLKGINRSLIHDSIFLQTLTQKKFNGYVMKKIKITKNGLAYAVISKRAVESYETKDVPTMVQVLSNIMNVEIWTTLSYDFQFNKWKASIRSKQIEVNNIAREFGGGGHKTIAAAIFSNKKQFYRFLARLDLYLEELGYEKFSKNQKTKFSWSNLRIKFHRVTKYRRSK